MTIGFGSGYTKNQIAGLQWKFAKLNQKMVASVRVAVEISAQEIVAAQKKAAPVQSGSLRDAIMYDMPKGTAAAKVFVNYQKNGKPYAPHAHLVEFGTAPHTIVSPTGKRLGKNGIFGWRVYHPGTAPHPFFYPTYQMLRPAVKKRIRDAVKAAAQEAARGG